MAKTLQNLSDAMRKIDFGMLTTLTEGGAFASRPMSNNGEVEYEGHSYFFSYDDARAVADIETTPQVGLTFTGAPDPQGAPPLFISVEGNADLVRDKSQFAAHWTRDLDHWFEQGIDTPGLVMIRVIAKRIHYWAGSDEGEITL